MRPLSLSRRRHGVTLVELLVVITIILMLTAVAIPLVRMVSRDQEVSEAERLVHSYLQTARTRAIESGKSVGVLIQRDPTLPNAGTLLYQVEVPDSYAGDMADAVVRVCNVTVDTSVAPQVPHWPYYTGATDGFPVFKVSIRPQDFLSCVGVLRLGDRMRLNSSGPWYVISEDKQDATSGALGHNFPLDSNGYINFDLTDLVDTSPKDGWVDDNGGWLTLAMDRYVQPGAPNTSTWPSGSVKNLNWSIPATFEIRRQPVPNSAPPLRLPKGMVVDLSSSGTESSLTAFAQTNADDKYPVIVLFNATGELDRIYVHNQENIVTEPVYFLVGTRDRAGTPGAEDGLANWQDMKNVWIAVNSKTGHASAAPVAADATSVDPNTKIQRPATLLESRDLARKLYLDMRGP